MTNPLDVLNGILKVNNITGWHYIEQKDKKGNPLPDFIVIDYIHGCGPATSFESDVITWIEELRKEVNIS